MYAEIAPTMQSFVGPPKDDVDAKEPAREQSLRLNLTRPSEGEPVVPKRRIAESIQRFSMDGRRCSIHTHEICRLQGKQSNAGAATRSEASVHGEIRRPGKSQEPREPANAGTHENSVPKLESQRKFGNPVI